MSDAAAGVGGDITITGGDEVLLAVEVSERFIDKARVVATFNTKIVVNRIEDYLFFVGSSGYDPEAKAQAHQYFAQGHEVNFVDIKAWLLMSLVTMGKGGQEILNQELLALLESAGVPQVLRVKWNDHINTLVSIAD